MLRKKTSGVANGPQSSSFIGKAAEMVVDRRAFLRGSGLADRGDAQRCGHLGVPPDKGANCVARLLTAVPAAHFAGVLLKPPTRTVVTGG